MKALVLGANGMLGHRLWRALGEQMEAYAAVRRPYAELALLGWFDRTRAIDAVDVTSDQDLGRVFAVVQPDVVVNAVGIVKQRNESANAAQSIAINALLPHRLAAMCAEAGARLIHLSTDCVFSGSKGNYVETDSPDAVDLYGRSKLLGEVNGPGCLTIRTSMIGREIGSKRGLLEWFLSHRGEVVKGFTRARFSGLTTVELARVIREIVQHQPQLEGLWHVAGEQISKFDLLSLVNDAFGLRTTIEPDDSFVCDRTLDATRFNDATGYGPPSWATMVAELAADPTPYNDWTAQWISNARDRLTVSTS